MPPRGPMSYKRVTAVARNGGKNVRLTLECGHTKTFRGGVEVPGRSHCLECPPEERVRKRKSVNHVMPAGVTLEKRTKERTFVILDGKVIGIIDRRFVDSRFRFFGHLMPGCTVLPHRLTKRVAVELLYRKHMERDDQ